jgi:hypothetical protein
VSLKQCEQNLRYGKQAKNPQISTLAHFKSPGPNIFQTLHLLYKYGALFHSPHFFFGLGSQIEIFGEAPRNLKSEQKIVYCIKNLLVIVNAIGSG